MANSSPFQSSPAELFGTSFSDTRKIIQAFVNYLNPAEDNASYADGELVSQTVRREASENPTFWNAVGIKVHQLLQATPRGQPYQGLSVSVPLFDRAILELDPSILEEERSVLWTQSGTPRRVPGRSVSAPPPAAAEADQDEEDLEGTEDLLGDDGNFTSPSPSERQASPPRIPTSAKGKSTPRQDLAQVRELAKATQGLQLGVDASVGNALLDSRIQELEDNPIPGRYSAPRSKSKTSTPTRRASSARKELSPFMVRSSVPPPPPPATRRDDSPDDSGSEDGDGLLPDDFLGQPGAADDSRFVEELLAAPAEDYQLSAASTELGRAIASRAQAFRKLKKNTLREFVLRSNAPLPVDVREAIIRNEYVDFGKVLAFNPATTYTQPLGDASLQLVVEAPSPSKPVTTFTDWLDIFTKVVRYTLTAYPMRADEFAAYSEWFRQRATRTPALLSRYLEYDAHYRKHLGMFGYPDSLFGASTHFDLLNEVVYHPDTSSSSSASGSPSRSLKRSTVSSDPREEYCRRWNSGTEHENCQRLHRCSRCNSAEHTVRSCKKASGSGGGARGGAGKKDGERGGAVGDASGKSLRQ